MAENVNENEATVLQFDGAENISLSDILYLIQGTGTDRDRQMTLEQLRDFLQAIFTKLKVIGTGGDAVLSNGSLILATEDGTAKITVADGVEVQNNSSLFGANGNGLYLKYGTNRADLNYNSLKFSEETQGYSVTLSLYSNYLVLYGNLQLSGIGKFAGPVEMSSTANVKGKATFDGEVAANKSVTVNGSATLNGEVVANNTAAFNKAVTFNNTASGRHCIPWYESESDMPADGLKGELGLCYYNGALFLYACDGAGNWNKVSAG